MYIGLDPKPVTVKAYISTDLSPAETLPGIHNTERKIAELAE